jgi:hypothetical protein
MNNVKTISRILFYITRAFAFFYFACVLLSSIELLSGWWLNFYENDKYFQVCLPFTETPLLNGDYNPPYILFEFLMPLFLYGLFAFWLGNVFKVFFQPKLFTANSIKHLQRFYLANFIIPALMVGVVSFIDQPEISFVMVIVLHAVIGVFAYFLAAIFKKGVNLQNEQDLII